MRWNEFVYKVNSLCVQAEDSQQCPFLNVNYYIAKNESNAAENYMSNYTIAIPFFDLLNYYIEFEPVNQDGTICGQIPENILLYRFLNTGTYVHNATSLCMILVLCYRH